MFKWKDDLHASTCNPNYIGKLEMIKLSEEGMLKAETGWNLGLLHHRVSHVVNAKNYLIYSTFFFQLKKYWSIIDLQCCVNFCCVAEWLSYTHMCYLSCSFPLRFITRLDIDLWLHSRTLLFIHSVCFNYQSNLSTQNQSEFIPSANAQTIFFLLSEW